MNELIFFLIPGIEPDISNTTGKHLNHYTIQRAAMEQKVQWLCIEPLPLAWRHRNNIYILLLYCTINSTSQLLLIYYTMERCIETLEHYSVTMGARLLILPASLEKKVYDQSCIVFRH